MLIARNMWRFFAALGIALMLAGPVGAVAVDTPLKDPAQEARARNLHKQLRCLVCQSQSIDDSNAELARDLRALVRERIAAGDSDSQVIDFLVARYGDWVLFKPPMNPATLVLWFGPLALLLGISAFVLVRLRRSGGRPAGADADLTSAEQARLKALLDDEPTP